MKRDYGIDLLKMTAMAMVVAHHILQSGGVEGLLLADGGLHCFEQIFHCFCYCAVDCFVMATGYIMCRHGFKYSRIFKLWRQVVGYSLAVVAIALIFKPVGFVGWRDWAGSLMPIAFNRYWFFTEYVALFFSIPFLNKLLESLTTRERNVLILSGFCLLCVMPFVAGRDLFIVKWGYSFVWFVYLYLLGAYLALEDFKAKIAYGFLWLALAAGVLGSTGGVVVGSISSTRIGGGARIAELGYSYASPTLLLEAVALLLLFAKVEVKNERMQKMIGFVAPSTFVVYVVHSNTVFRHLVEWNTCFHWLADLGECGVIIGTILTAVLIFVAIVILDVIRRTCVKTTSVLLSNK